MQFMESRHPLKKTPKKQSKNANLLFQAPLNFPLSTDKNRTTRTEAEKEDEMSKGIIVYREDQEQAGALTGVVR